jgi:hypothetical protein
MKKLFVLSFVALWLVAAGSSLAQDDKPFFDMVNCAFCKHLMDDPNLMPHTAWEHFKTANGMITVTTVEDDALLPAYRAMAAKMEETGKLMQTGTMLPMCGMCTEMGTLIMSGAKWEQFTTKHGDVSIMTSDNPEVVKGIHALADRIEVEMKKLEAAAPAAPKAEPKK